MLHAEQKDQVRELFTDLKAEYAFDTTIPPGHAKRNELLRLLDDVVDCSDKLRYETREGNQIKIKLLKENKETGLSFRGVPSGNEFSSLLLAILNCEGKGRNIADEDICNRIKRLTVPTNLLTYISIECDQCSTVVQALNAITVLNPHITHEIVEGSLHKMEVIDRQIMQLPTVFINGELFHIGYGNMEILLRKLEILCGNL